MMEDSSINYKGLTYTKASMRRMVDKLIRGERRREVFPLPSSSLH